MIDVCGVVIERKFSRNMEGTTFSQCGYVNKGFLRFNVRENSSEIK